MATETATQRGNAGSDLCRCLFGWRRSQRKWADRVPSRLPPSRELWSKTFSSRDTCVYMGKHNLLPKTSGCNDSMPTGAPALAIAIIVGLAFVAVSVWLWRKIPPQPGAGELPACRAGRRRAAAPRHMPRLVARRRPDHSPASCRSAVLCSHRKGRRSPCTRRYEAVLVPLLRRVAVPDAAAGGARRQPLTRLPPGRVPHATMRGRC